MCPRKEEPKLIKSRKRVRDHGEVFTPDWLVRDMCDLVGAACDDVGTRFLEPACGDGNFLTEILRRKLRAARRVAGGRADTATFRREAFRALTSLYGIDILADNVLACRAKLLAQWEAAHGLRVRRRARWAECRRAAAFVLAKNIRHGDTLHPEGTAFLAPIVFVEWRFAPGEEWVSGRMWSLAEMLDTQGDTLPFAEETHTRLPTVRYWDLGADTEVPARLPPAPPFVAAEIFADGTAQPCFL